MTYTERLSQLQSQRPLGSPSNSHIDKRNGSEGINTIGDPKGIGLIYSGIRAGVEVLALVWEDEEIHYLYFSG